MQYLCYGIAMGSRGISQVELDLTVSIKAMPNVLYFASKTFLQKPLMINLQMLHKLKTFMQYFFQDNA